MKKHYPIETLRHSIAHLMATAILEIFPGARFGVGPIIENGFYYDFDLPKQLTSDDLPKIEERMVALIKKSVPYRKKEINTDEAIEVFKKLKQPYKVELLEDLKKRGTTKISSKEESVSGWQKKEKSLWKKKGWVSIYQTGNFTDLCLGPHVQNANAIDPESFKLTRVAGAYWRGSEKNPMLQRIYGIAFTNRKELDIHIKLQEEIEKRDHRKLGAQLDLFHFEDVSPGAAFWHHKGMIILNELEGWWKDEHEKLGYLESSTPILVKKELFEKSGHWDYYQESTFKLKVDKEVLALKPMNCPESTLIYSFKIRSYKDLPLRISEIGRLHRNERSGVLMGLFRVRQITMDDAHIYARPDQVQKEITGVLKLVKSFYKIFGLNPAFFLATKPDKAMGDTKLWQKAEQSLEYSLKKNKLKYELKPRDGAFYGPKIDIHITDCLGRSWQIATLQLDFQMPERFDLFYIDEKGRKKRPIMIHRAIFGSFERFTGILLEHFGGALPLWLSPVQVKLIPVGARHEKYLEQIKARLKKERIRVEVSIENETVSKKIRAGEIQKIPYLAVAGDKEMKSDSLRIRSTRIKQGKNDLGKIKISKFIERLKKEIEKKKYS